MLSPIGAVVFSRPQSRYNSKMKVYSFESVSKRSRKKVHNLWQKLRHNKRSIFIWLFRIGAVGVGCIALLFVYLSFTLPDPNTLLQRTVPESTKIYDRNGQLLYEIHGEAKRTLVTLDNVAEPLKQATIAIEDKDFYKHNGISFRGLLRAVWVDVTSGSKQQGGSTITQQFVKNALLTKEKKWIRKLKEVILSIELEARYSKDEILQLYINEIPYGRNAYGIEAASKAYFNKSAKDLTLAESSYLAALPQSTTYYNPFGPNREALDRRHETILGVMEAQGYISKEQKESALEEKVVFLPPQNSLKAPHFVLYVQDYLADKFGEGTLEEGGLKVYTTLDLGMQEIAEKIVNTQGEKNAKTHNGHNAGFIAIDPKTGQILTMVGSRDFFGKSYPEGCKPGRDCLFDPSVNTTLSPQQPGSSFKPFVYLTGFKKEFGYSPASLLMDVHTNFGRFGNSDYTPKNYSGTNHGPVSVRKALAGSLNVPAVKMLALVGVNNATQTARDLGITSPLQDCGLSLVLGGCEVRLLDHTAAYGVLANGGIKNPTTPILKIESRTGETLEEYKENGTRVADEQAVYEVTNILSDDAARSYIFGAGGLLTLPGRPVACKTGTTNKWKDGWSMCYTPSLAVGAWVGNSNNTDMKSSADGGRVAAPMTNQFLREVLKGKPVENFKAPQGIATITVDAVSGKLPTEFTPQTKDEIFASYAVPKEYDNIHIAVRIDRTTGLPATNLTPPADVELRPYLVYHSEKPDNNNWESAVKAWMEQQQLPLPPDGSQSITPENPGEGPVTTITEPRAGETLTRLPFSVIATPASQNSVARMDLLIDGQLIESKTSGPYNFVVSKRFSDGPRTIAIHSVDQSGRAADISIPVIFAMNTPLTIVSPGKNSQVTGPVNLQAISGTDFGNATFYIDDIAVGTSTANPDNDAFRYNYIWDAPKAGTYRLQVKAGGNASAKITFEISEE